MASFNSVDSLATDYVFSVLSDPKLDEASIKSNEENINSNLCLYSSTSCIVTKSNPRWKKPKHLLDAACSLMSKMKQRELHTLS